MSLPADTPPAVTDTLGYLQHHLQELTERQNASEHIINNTLAGLTAQIQQLTQLMTGPAPAPTVAPPLVTTFPSPVNPPSPVPSAPTKQWTRPKLLSPPDFSSERTSGRAFLNSCMLYLRLALEQFSCDEEKIFWTLAFFKDGHAARWSENLARRRTLAFFLSSLGLTLNNSSGVSSFRSTQKQMPLILWQALRTTKETGRWTITWTASSPWSPMLDTLTPGLLW